MLIKLSKSGSIKDKWSTFSIFNPLIKSYSYLLFLASVLFMYRVNTTGIYSMMLLGLIKSKILRALEVLNTNKNTGNSHRADFTSTKSKTVNVQSFQANSWSFVYLLLAVKMYLLIWTLFKQWICNHAFLQSKTLLDTDQYVTSLVWTR